MIVFVVCWWLCVCGYVVVCLWLCVCGFVVLWLCLWLCDCGRGRGWSRVRSGREHLGLEFIIEDR